MRNRIYFPIFVNAAKIQQLMSQEFTFQREPKLFQQYMYNFVSNSAYGFNGRMKSDQL